MSKKFESFRLPDEPRDSQEIDTPEQAATAQVIPDKTTDKHNREKYLLSEEDYALPLKEAAKKYNVSRATWYRAKKLGWFVPDYHRVYTLSLQELYDEREKRRDIIETGGKHTLSDEEKSWPNKKLAAVFGIVPQTANKAKKRGWIYVNYHPGMSAPKRERKLPDKNKWERSQAELAEDIRIGVRSAIKQLTTGRLDENLYDDVMQQTNVGLYELSGEDDFSSPQWRRVTAKNIALGYLSTWQRRAKKERELLDSDMGDYKNE